MGELVRIINNQVTTTSGCISRTFNKRHSDILRSIQTLECSQEFTQRNFALSEYKDPTGRILPMYNITFQGFMFLVMGFTGSEAAKLKEAYIKAFDDMEAYIRNQQQQISTPKTYLEALKALVVAEENNQKLLEDNKAKEIIIQEQTPKVEYHDQVLQSETLIKTTTIAQDFGMTAVKFNKLLESLGVQHKSKGTSYTSTTTGKTKVRGQQWIINSKYIDKGYVSSKTTPYTDKQDKQRTAHLTYWTEAGRAFIYDLLAKNDYKRVG